METKLLGRERLAIGMPTGLNTDVNNKPGNVGRELNKKARTQGKTRAETQDGAQPEKEGKCHQSTRSHMGEEGIHNIREGSGQTGHNMVNGKWTAFI